MDSIRVLQNLKTGQFSLVGDNGRLIKKANEYLEMIEIRGLSRCTTRAYAYDLLFIFRWLKKTRRIFKTITQKDLVKLTQYQQALKAKPRSINHRLTICEVFYRFCYDLDLPHVKGMSYPNPYYKGLPKDREFGLFQYKRKNRPKFRVKVPRTFVDSLEIKEVNQFLESVTRYRDIAIIFLMLFCGLRASEVLSLLIDDINFTEKQIRVKGKGNKERVLPLTEQVITVLEKYMRLERPSHCKTRSVFVVLQGKHRAQSMTYAGLRSLFRYKRNLSGITKANPHRFRHAFGTSMAREGVQLPVLQKMMGHADGQTTLQYINLSMKDITAEYQRAIEKIKGQYEAK
jgi:site-specific recombinase XerD